MMMRTWMKGSLCLALAVSASPAFAQAPAGIMKQDSASKGSTDVAAEGFQKTAVIKEEDKEATELKIAAGGLLATGNTRSMAGTATSNLRIRRGMNEYSAALAANYARGAAAGAESKTTAENFQGRIRYDRFLSKEWALFLSESARRDRFQGLNLRLNFDPGVAYYFLKQDKQRAWAELGYDLQYDIRRDEALTPEVPDKTATRHSGRAFLGYENSINEAVRFNTGLEYIQAIVDTENWRLNWDVGLTSQLAGNFSLATTFSLRYDHNPLPAVKTTDTMTAISLVYTLL